MILDIVRPSHLVDTATLLAKSSRPANGYEELANGIILQAVKDYRAALRGEFVNHKSPEWVIQDCEKFFQSKWFTVLTKVDGVMLMNKLREELRNER